MSKISIAQVKIRVYFTICSIICLKPRTPSKKITELTPLVCNSVNGYPPLLHIYICFSNLYIAYDFTDYKLTCFNKIFNFHHFTFTNIPSVHYLNFPLNPLYTRRSKTTAA